MAVVQEGFSSFPIFEGLRPETMAFLASLAEARQLSAGEIVFEQGGLGNDLFLLEQGSVEVVLQTEGKEDQRLATLSAPNFFGEMSILECQPRSATVRALENCRFHVLLSTDLYSLFERWPDQYALLLHRLARYMAKRLRGLGHEFSS